MTKSLTQTELLALYNGLADKPVKKFESRAIALDRVEKLLKRLHLTRDQAIAKVEALHGITYATSMTKDDPAPAPASAPAPEPTTIGTRVKQDRVTEDADGFYAVVNGITYGTWMTKGAALAGMKTEQERAARKGRATPTSTKGDGPKGSAATLIRLCTREQGATAKEMASALGWPTIAARATCQKVADRFGYKLNEIPKSKGESLRFHLAAKSA